MVIERGVEVRTRYAPSPTGMPHIGNIRTALFSWLLARHHGGKFLLRIEDTDRNRLVEGSVEEQMRALKWLGIEWDEGPDIGGPNAPYYQSDRLEIYAKLAQDLLDTGWGYKCWCTYERLEALRQSQEERGLPTGYDRKCRFLPQEDKDRNEREGLPFTVRFAVPREGSVSWHDLVFGEQTWENRILQDQILLKSDGFPTYHLAAIVDDHLMEITHVIRGEEWLPSAPLHILIFEAFGWTPPNYVHVTSILGANRKKLSKREAAAEFLNYEKGGFLPEAVFNFLALLGWSPPDGKDLYTREEIISEFGIDGLIGHPAIFNEEKLLWYNGVYIRALGKHDLAERCLPFLVAAGLAPTKPTPDEHRYIGEVIALEQERMKTLAEAPVLADFFLLPDDKYVFDEKAVAKWFTNPAVAERLTAVREKIAGLSDVSAESLEQVVREVIEAFQVKGGEVIHPVRVAVTGRTTGPGLFETMSVLGRERLLRRFDRAIGMFA